MTFRLNSVDPDKLHRWQLEEKAVLIDIREADEYAREHIPGSRLVPLSAFDAADFADSHDKIAVFHCGSGSRTAQAAPRILAQGFQEVYQLDGGLAAWKEQGYPTSVNPNMPIPIQRQVQIIAGSMILLGVLLAWLISPWFVLLSAFVGAGLLFAGVSGSCAMATLLGRLPYNRRALEPTNEPA